MKRVVVDGGTCYTKLHYLDSGRRRIVPTRRFFQSRNDYRVAAATGHNAHRTARRRVNELVALAEGTMRLVPDDDFTVLDCGARDVKYVTIKGRRVAAMDWNTECGAFAGQMIDLLQRYFGIQPDRLPRDSKRIPVVCGVLGMTYLFDRVSQGATHEEAFAEFLRGVSHNCESLVGKPDRLYVSGGLCMNRAFLESFSCEVVPLGRFVLVEGLLSVVGRRGLGFDGP
ncbi:MAG: ATPase [bacterium]